MAGTDYTRQPRLLWMPLITGDSPSRNGWHWLHETTPTVMAGTDYRRQPRLLWLALITEDNPPEMVGIDYTRQPRP